MRIQLTGMLKNCQKRKKLKKKVDGNIDEYYVANYFEHNHYTNSKKKQMKAIPNKAKNAPSFKKIVIFVA